MERPHPAAVDLEIKNYRTIERTLTDLLEHPDIQYQRAVQAFILLALDDIEKRKELRR